MCGKPTKQFPNGNVCKTCSPECRAELRRLVPHKKRGKTGPRKPMPPQPSCPMCGSPCPLKAGRGYKWRSTCSEACENAHHAQTMAATNRVHASPRMLARNPMSREDVRAQVSETLRAIGHQPKQRGGNGRGLTAPQARLLAALGSDWEPEFAVKTGGQLGLPPAVKIDVAHPIYKIAIEVDGPSHSTLRVKDADRRKETFFLSLGWTVLRFTNRHLMERLGDALQTVSSTISRLTATTTTSPTES